MKKLTLERVVPIISAGESRSLFDTATDQADADTVEQTAEDDMTAPRPQHPSASPSSYPTEKRFENVPAQRS